MCTHCLENNLYQWVPNEETVREYVLKCQPGETSVIVTNATANENQVAGKHYKDKEIQPWDYIYANNLCYFTGNCVKYVSRWKDKGGVDDLKKARHYLDKLIELEEGKE
jgi:hypothetical protein